MRTRTEAPVLLTERLRLRPYKFDDFDAFSAYFKSPRSVYTDGPVSEESAWDQFSAGAGRWLLVGYGAWSVERREDAAVVGLVSLNAPISLPEIELGWILWHGFEGHGYAFEAAVCARQFAFDELESAGLLSCIHKDNVRSIRLAERLGCVRDTAIVPPDPENDLIFRHAAN